MSQKSPNVEQQEPSLSLFSLIKSMRPTFFISVCNNKNIYYSAFQNNVIKCLRPTNYEKVNW